MPQESPLKKEFRTQRYASSTFGCAVTTNARAYIIDLRTNTFESAWLLSVYQLAGQAVYTWNLAFV